MKQSLFPEDLIPQPVKKFRSLEGNGTRLIYINGQLVYCLEAKDELSCRHAAVQLYLCWKINQNDIASAWDVTDRTINSWIRIYRSEGIEGLKRKTMGTPVKVTSDIKKKIVSMRQDNFNVTEICRRLCLKKSSVYSVLDENKNEQNELPLEIDQHSELMNDQADTTALEDESQPNPESAVTEQIVDPLDRSFDRFSAQIGFLYDAEPIFSECDQVELAGAFLAVALISKSDFFDSVDKTYITLGPAFYGLRNAFMCLFLMAILRIENPEQLSRKSARKLGRLMGLDRCPSVKTLRRKIRILSFRNQALNLMNLLRQNLSSC